MARRATILSRNFPGFSGVRNGRHGCRVELDEEFDFETYRGRYALLHSHKNTRWTESQVLDVYLVEALPADVGALIFSVNYVLAHLFLCGHAK
jgi:hypothetical protein